MLQDSVYLFVELSLLNNLLIIILEDVFNIVLTILTLMLITFPFHAYLDVLMLMLLWIGIWPLLTIQQKDVWQYALLILGHLPKTQHLHVYLGALITPSVRILQDNAFRTAVFGTLLQITQQLSVLKLVLKIHLHKILQRDVLLSALLVLLQIILPGDAFLNAHLILLFMVMLELQFVWLTVRTTILVMIVQDNVC